MYTSQNQNNYEQRRVHPVPRGNTMVNDGPQYDRQRRSEQLPTSTSNQDRGNAQNPSTETQRQFFNIKAHGNKSAVEVAPDTTAQGWHTIRIESAAKLENSKAYNWEGKVSLQLTKTELPVVIGTLLGYYRKCEYKNHGAGSDKWLMIENQCGSGKHQEFFFKVGQTTNRILLPTPVSLPEANMMGLLALSQYIKNFEGVTADAALSSIKTMCTHMLRNQKGGG